ncbi:unnamed protein product [Moneuplotes crassus]|uniref:Coatomer subunit delta n=2 Tax=Euplotes crassus TaxID=5936 RepID=A0AAD1UF26_EUPCR|nr:unnamed protein product [Moneuplotes crassus]
MVVISSTICDKKGKIIVGRQYIDISKLKMEEYIKTFPKLIESGSQCTYIDTDSVRYVYLPIDDLYLVLITNKMSHIIEDTEILRQLHKIILKICNTGINEKQVSNHAFDLILSFDDVITVNGYRDSVTMSQLEAYLEMDSTDEKMHMKMRKIREKEAKEIASKKMKEIKEKNKLEAKTSKDHDISESFDTPEKERKPTSKFSKLGGDKQPFGSASKSTSKGMQLGKPKKIQGASQLGKGFGFDEDKSSFFTPKEEEKEPEPEAQDENTKVDLTIKESINCEVNKFSEVCKFVIKGEASFDIPEDSEKVTQFDFGTPKPEYFKQFKIHPDIDKEQFKNDGVIVASDQEIGFAPGSSLGAFRYKITDEVESSLPFEISIFATKAAGGKQKISLELEYQEDTDNEKKSEFSNINIFIKVSDEPKLIKIDNNSTSNLDNKSGMISWMISALTEESSNSLLQFYTTTEESMLFPLIVSFDYKGSAKSVFDIYS